MNLYTQYQMIQFDLLAFSIRLTKDESIAKDLVQDAYIKAMDHENIFETMSTVQVKAWFFKTIKNLFVDLCRKRKNEVLVAEEDTASMMDFQNRQILYMSISELPEPQQTIINLKFHYGYKSKEIADMLSMNPSTVRNYVADGIKRMRKVYLEEENEWKNY